MAKHSYDAVIRSRRITATHECADSPDFRDRSGKDCSWYATNAPGDCLDCAANNGQGEFYQCAGCPVTCSSCDSLVPVCADLADCLGLEHSGGCHIYGYESGELVDCPLLCGVCVRMPPSPAPSPPLRPPRPSAVPATPPLPLLPWYMLVFTTEDLRTSRQLSVENASGVNVSLTSEGGVATLGAMDRSRHFLYALALKIEISGYGGFAETFMLSLIHI